MSVNAFENGLEPESREFDQVLYSIEKVCVLPEEEAEKCGRKQTIRPRTRRCWLGAMRCVW